MKDRSDARRGGRSATVDAALIALRRIFRATDLFSKTLARETGLSVPQLFILQMLKREGVVTASDIAAEINLTQATVTTILNRMDEYDLIRRQRDSADRRKIQISLTDKGRAILEKAPDVLQDRFLERFSALQDWEQTSIVATLQRVAHLMDAAEIDAAPLLDVGAFDRHLEDKPSSYDSGPVDAAE